MPAPASFAPDSPILCRPKGRRHPQGAGRTRRPLPPGSSGSGRRSSATHIRIFPGTAANLGQILTSHVQIEKRTQAYAEQIVRAVAETCRSFQTITATRGPAISVFLHDFCPEDPSKDWDYDQERPRLNLYLGGGSSADEFLASIPRFTAQAIADLDCLTEIQQAAAETLPCEHLLHTTTLGKIGGVDQCLAPLSHAIIFIHPGQTSVLVAKINVQDPDAILFTLLDPAQIIASEKAVAEILGEKNDPQVLANKLLDEARDLTTTPGYPTALLQALPAGGIDVELTIPVNNFVGVFATRAQICRHLRQYAAARGIQLIFSTAVVSQVERLCRNRQVMTGTGILPSSVTASPSNPSTSPELCLQIVPSTPDAIQRVFNEIWEEQMQLSQRLWDNLHIIGVSA